MFRKSNVAEIQRTQVQPSASSADSDTDGAQDTMPLSSSGGPGAMPPQKAASRGLSQMFGLHPSASVLTILVDLMLFGGDVVTLGAMIPLGVVVAAVLAFIVYRIQITWYGDDHDSALNKAFIVGLLTVIPVPLSPLVAIPGGLIGIVKVIRRK
jgi:hypothetical protein